MVARPRAAQLRSFVAADLKAWRVSAHAALWMALVPVAIVASVTVLAFFALDSESAARPVFRFITAEDSLLEWPQALCTFGSSVLMLLIAYRARRIDRRVALLYVLLAVGTLFVTGEEISWGQRVFGWGTPEALSAVNHQDELNIHNIRPIQTTFNFVVLFASAYGMIVPFLRGPRWAALKERSYSLFLVPPTFLAPAFAMSFVYRFLRQTFLYEATFITVKIGEAYEVALYIGLLLFVALLWRRLRMTTVVTAADKVAQPRAIQARPAVSQKPDTALHQK